MRKILFILSILLITKSNLFSQQGECIFTIDNSLNVYSDEFMRECSSIINFEDTTGINEMLNNYADYRLQIYEAYQKKLDTTAEIRSAIEYYKNYLVVKHVADSKKSQETFNKIFKDSEKQYRVSHIQININDLLLNDSLAAYYKAEKIKNRILGGQKFELAARQMSDDPSANYNGGDLGYLTIMQMPGKDFAKYVVENKDNNEISSPIRCGNSYHIIKVVDCRQVIDSVSISCIKLTKTHKYRIDDSLQTLANEICEKLKSGENFFNLQKKYSDDKATHNLTLFEAIDKYGIEICDLKNEGNTYSKPINFYDGFYIVRLNSLTKTPIDEKYKEKIYSQYLLSDVFENYMLEFLDSIKNVSGYTKLGDYSILSKAISDSSIYNGKWIPEDGLLVLSDNLFSIGTQTYTIGDFARYIYETQKKCSMQKINSYLTYKYNEMVNYETYKQAIKMLSRKNKNFNIQIQEYTYPLLYQKIKQYHLLTNKNIDSSEISEYYETCKQNYLSGYKIHIRFYDYLNESNYKKANKFAQKLSENPNMAIDYNLIKPLETDTFQLGQNNKADIILNGFNIGQYSYPADRIIKLENQHNLAIITLISEPEPLPLSEVYQSVYSEYLKHKEANYTNTLKTKYNIQIIPEANQILSNAIINYNK
ncbi:MAG: peptidylprolyl isomerase [Bacteroidales bacterium]|nr:peptidylprolyl isomerase [Bacteroidales bacterium]